MNWDIDHVLLLTGTAPSSWSLATAGCEKDLLWIFGIPASSYQLLGDSCFCWHACMHRSLEQGQHICRQVTISVAYSLISVHAGTHRWVPCPPNPTQRKPNLIQDIADMYLLTKKCTWYECLWEMKSPDWNIVISTKGQHLHILSGPYRVQTICNPERS